MKRDTILSWLHESDPRRLQELWRQADDVRHSCVGGKVHLRGLLEISSHCNRSCAYCGLRAENRNLERYKMSAEEIIDCAHKAMELGYGTVVLQAGESPMLTAGWIADVIRRIKGETSLAVTLSLGERSLRELELWKRHGADRYLLRFETSNSHLYSSYHPPIQNGDKDRISLLHCLRELDYEVGSGIMIGLPGQTFDDLANDIILFSDLRLDMIGIGPYLPNPHTPLGKQHGSLTQEQERERIQLTHKVLALTRIICPLTNIPSTTALSVLNRETGHQQGLQHGANVVMPNLTPERYRKLYDIYPDKGCVDMAYGDFHKDLLKTIADLGRTVGTGPGSSPRYMSSTLVENEMEK
jgi:biotin synthase